jgi:hypothetical protein
MSSIALPRDAASDPALGRRLAALLSSRGHDILLASPIVALLAVLLVRLPQDFGVDSWLGLVAGRDVWQHGIPHVNTLTAFSHGTPWVDQQWLAQLSMYALYLVGGLALVGFLNVLLLVSGLAMAAVAVRRRGAASLPTLLTLTVCMLMILTSRQVRTQELAVPLFVGLVWLLSADSRAPSLRVYWCLPILALWANLHGSVTLGASLVGLHVVTGAWQNRAELRHSARAWVRPALLLAGSAAALLATPYGLSIVGYYHSTMVSGTLRQTVSEWKPLTAASPATVVTVLLATGVALWSFGRRPDRTTPWEKTALLFVALATFEVNRNSLFLGLLTLMILPLSVRTGRSAGSSEPAVRIRLVLNGAIAAMAAAILPVTIALTFARPDARIESALQRPGVLTAVERAVSSHPALRIMTQERFSDWLLWKDPALSGRLAYDIRFELLSAAQLRGIDHLFAVSSPNWTQAARGYRLLVLDRRLDPAATAAFRREPGVRVLYNDGERTVLLRSAREAKQS